VPVHMSAFSRHVSIMRLLPLGYEHYDARLAGLRRSGASRWPGEGLRERCRCLTSSCPSQPVSLANPLADACP